jgi:hypothetical protein
MQRASPFGDPALLTVLALCTIGITLAATTLALGVSSHTNPHTYRGHDLVAGHAAVVGGSAAEGPFFASLAFVRDARGDEVGECTGTVVARDAVLTAGHCAESILTGVRNPASGFVVATNSLNLASAATELSNVSSVLVDPAFKPLQGTGDAALLILSTPTTAPPLALASAKAPPLQAGTHGVIAGWGATSYGQVTLGTILQRANM